MSRRGKGKRAQRPPDGATWIWHTLDLLNSPAWRGRSIHCRRLLDFLEREHLQHGGNDNGELIATYSQLESEGIGRRYIHSAIEECELRGLVDVKRGGKKGAVLNELNRFRLTYLWHKTRKDGLWSWYEPTDNWTRYEPSPRKIGAQSATVTVDNSALPTVHKSQLPTSQAFEITKGGVVANCTLPSTFGEGGNNTHTASYGDASAANSKASALQAIEQPMFKSPELLARPTSFDSNLDGFKPISAIIADNGSNLGMVFALVKQSQSQTQSPQKIAA